jgi:2-phospho-L-lactate/phosphoenolpyruvate guanylyltransferase
VATVVIPFAGVDGKTRLHASSALRRDVSLAMLGDVLAACLQLGRALVVTSSAEAGALASELGADLVPDPGGGQGRAVESALAGLPAGGRVLIVNADLPCVTPDDLESFVAATPAGGLALVEARDGTTNALSLSDAAAFAPLYGPGSAGRFLERAHDLGVPGAAVLVPNLVDDVDTIEDLRRVQSRCGPRTRSFLALVLTGAAA